MTLFSAIKRKKDELMGTTFASDVLWTAAGRLSAAVGAIAVNVLIGNHYKAAGLGIFNQAQAFYMIFSLLATFGIDNSTLKYCAEFMDEKEKLSEVLTSSLIMVLISAGVMTLLLYGILSYFPGLADNPTLVRALIIILPALPLFSLNQVFRGFSTGVRRMKLYSVIDPLRWGSITAFTVFSLVTGKDIYFSIHAFIVTEAVILIFHVWVHLEHIGRAPRCFQKWWNVHLRFGSKTFYAAVVNQVNRKLDILMVGYFLTNEAAGLYSFAASAVRGIFLIGFVIQRNFSPIVSRLWARGEIRKLKEQFERIKKNLFLMVTPLLFLAGAAYPFAVRLLMKNPLYEATWGVFLVLLVGVGLMVLLNWSGGMLTMANFLNETLKVTFVTLGVNIAGNLIMIPLIGIYGAALSTSLSYVLRLFMIRYYVKNKMGIKLF